MIGVCVVSARRAVRATKQAEKIKEEQAGSWKSCTPNGGRCIWTRTSTLRPRPRRPSRAPGRPGEEAAGADAPDGSADDGESGEAAEEEDGGDD